VRRFRPDNKLMKLNRSQHVDAASGRGLGVALVAGLALMLVLGLVFAAAYGSQRITSSATALHTADETLRSATVVRAQLAIAAYTTSVDTAFGTNSASARDLAVTEARMALEEVAAGYADLVDHELEDRSLREEVVLFLAVGEALVSEIDSGAWTRTNGVSDSELQTSFASLTEALV
jgi:hypothetical protein